MNKNIYYNFGHDIFGPFLYGFTKWLRAKIRENGDQKVFFFSRDGYIMQHAWNVFENAEPSGVEEKYVYFSRNSLRRGLLWSCKSYEESLQYLSKRRFVDMAEIASYYGLTHEELEVCLNEVGVGWNENMLYHNLAYNDKIRTLYERYNAVIKERSKAQYETVIAYIKQIGMQGHCAIVDIGWHGTMQYYLEKLLDIAKIEVRLNGYYVGVNPILPIKSEAHGYVFNKNNLKYRKAALCFLGGFEKLFQSKEGSTDHYVIKEKMVAPVLKKYEYEGDTRLIGYINQLQDGALKYVAQSVKDNVAFEKDEEAFMPLIKFGKNPSYKDTQMFRFFYVEDGEKQFFIPQKPLYKFKPKEFVLALSNSIWKTGFMKAAFRIPLPYFWIYNIIRK